MTWTILVLVVGIILFMFGGMMLGTDNKKPSTANILGKNAIKLISVALIAGSVCRLYTPVYLLDLNPEILQEMITKMQERQNVVKAKEIRKYVRSNGDKMMADAPVLGNVDAQKTIFVWTDFSCPYCRRVHGELDRVLKNRDDVRVVIKNFSIHGALSDAPAKAVIAAKTQSNEKAAQLVEMLMTREYYSHDDMKDQSKLGEKVEANVMKFAAEAGLDTAKLKEDMKSEVVARELSNVRETAQRFEINGTPFLIIGERAFPGAIPYDQINAALD